MIFPSLSMAMGADWLLSLLRVFARDHSFVPSFLRFRMDVFSCQLVLTAANVSFLSLADLAFKEILFSMDGYSSAVSLV